MLSRKRSVFPPNICRWSFEQSGVKSSNERAGRKRERKRERKKGEKSGKRRERETNERLIFRIVWVGRAVAYLLKRCSRKAAGPALEMELICRCVPCTHLISITRSSLQKQSAGCSRATLFFLPFSLALLPSALVVLRSSPSGIFGGGIVAAVHVVSFPTVRLSSTLREARENERIFTRSHAETR